MLQKGDVRVWGRRPAPAGIAELAISDINAGEVEVRTEWAEAAQERASFVGSATGYIERRKRVSVLWERFLKDGSQQGFQNVQISLGARVVGRLRHDSQRRETPQACRTRI